MKADIMEVLMNPTHQRILQVLLAKGTGTTAVIREELSDIPPASLYRHVKRLLDAGLIEVAEEKKKRGTVEKTYRLVENPFGDFSNDKMAGIVAAGLFSIVGAFQRYFEKPDVDPLKDMLSFSTVTMMLSDEEYLQLLTDLGNRIQKEINNQPTEGRKSRRLSIVSYPNEE